MTLDQEILEFTTKLKFRQVEGSLPCARRTAEILRQLITTRRPTDGVSLLEDVRQVGVRLQRVKPMEVSVGNMARRIMRLIREEMAVLNEQPQQQQGYTTNLEQQCSSVDIEGIPRPNLELRNLLDYQIVQEIEDNKQQENCVSPSEAKKVKKPQWKGKQNVIDGVNELFFELDNVDTCICQQAVDHIHANEVVLTLGSSNTTYEFLVEAHKKRRFAVGMRRQRDQHQPEFKPLSQPMQLCMEQWHVSIKCWLEPTQSSPMEELSELQVRIYWHYPPSSMRFRSQCWWDYRNCPPFFHTTPTSCSTTSSPLQMSWIMTWKRNYLIMHVTLIQKAKRKVIRCISIFQIQDTIMYLRILSV
eukprot:TRINITY_DN6023_c0_g1_i12.p1 TRINITY_DN6023_c0_g1~~TRINITY_DN6023_c0_g1_i12.p1  ORF type:complete len:359 (-),score=31.29 TRINITY_DN6023_c0_g1_i12:137-1213(-)